MDGTEASADSLGVQVGEYSQIIIFRSKTAFLSVLAANPHMKPLFGTEEYQKRLFPGVYIAAITDN